MQCELPNKRIDSFNGFLSTPAVRDRVSLQAENVLLRGTVLKNTEHVFGARAAPRAGSSRTLRAAARAGVRTQASSSTRARTRRSGRT
jgi:hypothetical protein